VPNKFLQRVCLAFHTLQLLAFSKKGVFPEHNKRLEGKIKKKGTPARHEMSH